MKTICDILTGYLYKLSGLLVDSMELETQDSNMDFLKVITKPITERVVMVIIFQSLKKKVES